MADLYVQNPEAMTFTVQDLHGFVRQFRSHVQFERRTLCRRIAHQWSEFVENRDASPDREHIQLPSYGRVLLSGRPPGKKSGVYAIFRQDARNPPSCFYVGMSASDVRGRLRTHIGRDTDAVHEWADFGQLRRCGRLWLCTAIVSDWQRNEQEKQMLRLLEACLTVELRAWWHDGSK